MAQYDLARLLGESGSGRARSLQVLERSACTGYPDAVKDAAAKGLTLERCPPAKTDRLDGTWEGELPTVYTDQPGFRKPHLVKISIQGDQAKVYFRDLDGWSEVKPGAFHIRRHKSNAIIHAIDDGWDIDGNWVETWVVSVVRIDDEKMRATYQRYVNNIHLPRHAAHASMVRIAEGTFRRVSP